MSAKIYLVIAAVYSLCELLAVLKQSYGMAAVYGTLVIMFVALYLCKKRLP